MFGGLSGFSDHRDSEFNVCSGMSLRPWMSARGRALDVLGYACAPLTGATTRASPSRGHPGGRRQILFSISAHLSRLASGVYPSVRITSRKIIAYAGNLRDPSIPVGYPHLHQVYRDPSLLSPTRLAVRQDLQVIYHRYPGTGPRVYQFGASRNSTQMVKNSCISNENSETVRKVPDAPTG